MGKASAHGHFDGADTGKVGTEPKIDVDQERLSRVGRLDGDWLWTPSSSRCSVKQYCDCHCGFYKLARPPTGGGVKLNADWESRGWRGEGRPRLVSGAARLATRLRAVIIVRPCSLVSCCTSGMNACREEECVERKAVPEGTVRIDELDTLAVRLGILMIVVGGSLQMRSSTRHNVRIMTTRLEQHLQACKASAF
eukprot:3260939-Pleurochrysis_carterae.AAC.5